MIMTKKKLLEKIKNEQERFYERVRTEKCYIVDKSGEWKLSFCLNENEILELSLLRVPPKKLMRIISKMAKLYYKNKHSTYDIFCSSPDVLVAAYLSGKFPPEKLKLKVIHPKVASLIKNRIHYKVPKENITAVEECNIEVALMNLLYSKKTDFNIF